MLLGIENATLALDGKGWKELEITVTYTPL